jgi:NADH:ubiquinone oxidoreductase subunit D
MNDNTHSDEIRIAEAARDSAHDRSKFIAHFNPERVLAMLAEIEEASEDYARWITRMSEIREASGIGVKPMLGEIPAALAELRKAKEVAEAERDEANRKRAIAENLHAAEIKFTDAATERAVAAEARATRMEEALTGIADDYMTSEKHHSGYVLIPTAKFEQLCALQPQPQEPK